MSGEERNVAGVDPIIVEATRFTDGVMIVFADGRYAFFPSRFLYDHLEAVNAGPGHPGDLLTGCE
ncbi:hypothetical protein D1Y84_08115 [Acidipila sp. EB88]|nr:hypothetical protein D1Y84_08115 [Acidipila sp. EB88]